MRVYLLAALALGACARLEDVGKVPDFTPVDQSVETRAMAAPRPVGTIPARHAPEGASLWSGQRGALFGERRAEQPGDILTVVIEIDDSASISNSTARSRSGSENVSIGAFGGIPERLSRVLPEGASFDNLAQASSASSFGGDGSVSRNEQLELKVAATVVDVLPNGILKIQGSQEVRVNFEIRELLVTGYVRPADISRRNEITYDKIASARISYGGRGQISDVQQPRYGQQAADILLPF